MRADLYLTDEQHLSTLIRMRARIAGETTPTPELVANDSTTTGDKHTECSWGMCNDDPTFWLHGELMFPDRPPLIRLMLKKGSRTVEEVPSVSSKYHQQHQLCPFDRREDGEKPMTPNGCFYTCRVFRPSGPITREQALAMFDATIARFQARMEVPDGS